jgi:hypothetical protein
VAGIASIEVGFGRDEYMVVSLTWEDPACYANMVVLLREGMRRSDVLREAKKISGNGECLRRGLAEQLTDDVMGMLGDRGTVSEVGRVKTPEFQKEMRRRWGRRCLAFNLRAIGVSEFPMETVHDVLDEVYVQDVMES